VTGRFGINEFGQKSGRCQIMNVLVEEFWFYPEGHKSH
jgi:hypothetical protein